MNLITCSCFPFCSYHSRTFADPSQCFSKVSGSTHKWDLKLAFIYMVFFVSWCQHYNIKNTSISIAAEKRISLWEKKVDLKNNALYFYCKTVTHQKLLGYIFLIKSHEQKSPPHSYVILRK